MLKFLKRLNVVLYIVKLLIKKTQKNLLFICTKEQDLCINWAWVTWHVHEIGVSEL